MITDSTTFFSKNISFCGGEEELPSGRYPGDPEAPPRPQHGPTIANLGSQVNTRL